MQSFIPTFLYIKQHNQTGLKYFGKTAFDPCSYSGSGKYWKKHLKSHGNDVTTLWAQLFNTLEELTEYAVNFSRTNNIVESDEWANLIPENGVDGAPYGNTFTDDTKQKMRDAWTAERKSLQAIRRKEMNSARPEITCPHCGLKGTSANMQRYHFDKCNVVAPRIKRSRTAATKVMSEWTLQGPVGEIVLVTNMREFCRNNSLNNGTMSEVALGNRKQHKGWRVISPTQCGGTSP